MAESVTFIFTVSDGVTYFTVAESATFIFTVSDRVTVILLH